MQIRILFMLFYIVSLITCNSFICFAFDNIDTHPKLTRKVVGNSNLDAYLKFQLGLPDGIQTSLVGNEITKWIATGSIVEDQPMCRAANHFHNPLLPWDQSQSMDVWPQDQICQHRGWTPRYSNITWATGLTSPTDKVKPRNLQDMGWDSARTYFYNVLISTDAPTRETLFAKSFQAVGQTMHLLQDMAVPAHVRNDFLNISCS